MSDTGAPKGRDRRKLKEVSGMEALIATGQTLLAETGDARIDEWDAARLQLFLDLMVDIVQKIDEKAPPCPCGPHRGLGLRILGLLCLRTGATPSPKLMLAMQTCDGGTGYPPGSYPVYQARIAPPGGFPGGEKYKYYPRGHALRGADDFAEATLLEVLEQRISSQPGAATFEDLGMGGDGHGTIKRIEKLLRNVAAIKSRPPGVGDLWCDQCGVSNVPLQKCSACSNRSYCSKQCQKADWKAVHKYMCASMRESYT